MSKALEIWHGLLASRDMSVLDELLHDEVVFHSPVVHTPQQGKKICSLYLAAADQVLNNGKFRYLREVINDNDAALEFVTEINGVEVNGIDLIRWDENDKVIDFKVMVRPLQGVNAIHAAMGEMLQKSKK